MSFEVNFDGLVGPTHSYAGLSQGNFASMSHRGLVANPREAALQGLAKMRKLHEFGLRQAFLPPLERPSLDALHRLGFHGNPKAMLENALHETPELLSTACSASAMWTANAATVIPASDTLDGYTHFTPANLVCNLHRAFEPKETGENLRRIFSDGDCFVHHAPLLGGPNLGDEGAANHTRLAPHHSEPGLHLFVFGASIYQSQLPRPSRFMARQSLEASQAVARLSRLSPGRCIFIQQSPEAIDAGVFHNDVIATGNENVLLYHEEAFVETEQVIDELRQRYRMMFDRELITICIPSARVSLADAVKSYLFNSQLLTVSNGRMVLIAPEECRECAATHTNIEDVIADPANPVAEVHYLDLRASMANGGGPACLRLRVVLDETSWAQVADGVKINAPRLDRLEHWVNRHYREQLTGTDLGDHRLLTECHAALNELTEIIDLPEFYPFQR